MPIIESAKKRVRVTEKKNLRNRMVKTGVKTAIRAFEKADPKDASVQYSAATSAIDKAVAKGIVPKNAANRKKARLARKIATIAAE